MQCLKSKELSQKCEKQPILDDTVCSAIRYLFAENVIYLIDVTVKHYGTELVIIKLTKFAVPVRLCCGSGKLNVCQRHISIMFCDI